MQNFNLSFSSLVSCPLDSGLSLYPPFNSAPGLGSDGGGGGGGCGGVDIRGVVRANLGSINGIEV